MATSDIFYKEKNERRPKYLVTGAGGILYTLKTNTLYDRKTEEQIAFYNARKIDCNLFVKKEEKYYQVLSPGIHREIDRKTVVRTNVFHEEMLNDAIYIPGIQVINY